MRHRTRLLVLVICLLLGASLPAAVAARSGTTRSPGAGVIAKHPIEYKPVPPIRPFVASAAPYTPQQVRHAYGFDQLSQTGAGQVIGIVDAFDAPTIEADLATFIGTFGLTPMYGLPGMPSCTVAAGPHPCFQKTYAQGKPAVDPGWAAESSLDTQWAHVVAPGADILFVESKDADMLNLLSAVRTTVNSGAHIVSMSWGSDTEFSGEWLLDSFFLRPGVAFVNASGDFGTGPSYPSASPYVLTVGGTTLQLDFQGNRIAPETAWSGSGGGISNQEIEPPYQYRFPIPNTGFHRGIPDVSYNGDLNTGVLVYDSTPIPTPSGPISGWLQVGGTSAGAPQWAGLIALANEARGGPLSTTNIFDSLFYDAAKGPLYAQNYTDITEGTNGSCGRVCTATTGYDFVTGLGSPNAASLVPYLASH